MISTKKISAFLLTAICIVSILGNTLAQSPNPSYSIGTITGKYNFSYTQTPDQLVEKFPPDLISIAFTYQWESSLSPLFTDIPQIISTQASYSFSAPLAQTTYFRRKATAVGSNNFAYSNTIKISVVSANWEDVNYIREHSIITTGITDWKVIDQMAIGQKLQTTTYLDGLGRSLQNVTRETATPATSNGAWGDMVQFAQYDVMGRQPTKYLPYTTSTESGKFKTAPLTEQPQYYASTYNETSAFSTISFDNSPFNRIKSIKEPGGAWAGSTGNKVDYDVNTAVDNVQIFTVDYVQGNPPLRKGVYSDGALYKMLYTDVNGKQVVEYNNKFGQLILKKIQLADAPSSAHDGWICTYSIYDDFGLLRYQFQPEAIKYLDANSWSFAGDNGQIILKEQCFQYNYDDKGRTVWKKAPGAEPLKMLYDIRDRVVFMQDGNQAALPTPQWTANLYDELDRPVITTLYNTGKTIAALQADIDNAVSSTTINTTAAATPVTVLSVNNRNSNIATYSATNSIEFIDGFTSADGDQFVAQTDPAASNPATGISTTVLKNPISAADLGNTGVTTIIKYLFYDNYSFARAKTFDNGFTNTTAYSNTLPNTIAIISSKRTLNMPTGSMTRVLGTSLFLTSTSYFDEKGRHIQSLDENIKGGTDVSTMQYHFDGRLLSTSMTHSAPGTGYIAFNTLNKFLFDKLGRVVSQQKKIGSNAFKTISSFDYDDAGRLKTQKLDPEYNHPYIDRVGLESLTYNFNIHNQIIGINKDYALKTPGNYDKWAHFFGMYLGFDNRDNVFTQAQLNGQVGGIVWNTQGDDAQRKYEYTYDNSGRLVNAVFNEKQHPGEAWSNSKMDFSVSGSSGKITYDLNGNLLNMLQKGVMPGTAAPVTVDDLQYSYAAYSNKLQAVTDNSPLQVTGANGSFGDFKDGANGSSPDYVYDANGNLVIDLNKNVKEIGSITGADGIHYNFLDKPDQIRIAGKGTIKVVYDADGAKLQRVFIPEAGGSSTITTYINGYVYQESSNLTVASPAPFTGSNVSLAYINFEEGRIRVMQPFSQNNGLDALSENGNITLPNGKMGAYDYFILDYQKNVRMVLTEETHVAFNTATMESNRAAVESAIFGQTGAANEVEATRYPTPSGWQSVNNSSSVSRLGNIAGRSIGPNSLQKVMAGDQVIPTVQYYYQNATGGNNPNFANTLLASLGQVLGSNISSGTLIHNNVANITSQLNGSPAFINAMQPAETGDNRPKAFLTVLFFDERFNLVKQEDGGVQQAQVASTWSSPNSTLLIAGIAPKNGYVYTYVSNQSDQDVYFDNFKLSIAAGRIIEENHYYAYGLKIAGISSRKTGDVNEGKLKNPYQYNGKEMLDEDADLNWLDYGFRNYDPQIGRFPQLDPLTDDYPLLTPYQYASCDPITNIDIDGLEGCPSVGGMVGYVGNIGSSLASSGSAIFNGIVAVGRITSTAYQMAGAISSVISTSSQTHIIRQQNAGNAINGQNITPGVGGPTATAAQKALREKEGEQILEQVFKRRVTWLKTGGLFITFMLSSLDAGQGSFIKRKFDFKHFEQITTDVRYLTDSYIQEVLKRILEGNGSAQDKIYARELEQRGADRSLPEGEYYNPGTHDPKQGSKYVSGKSVLPENHEELWKGSIIDPKKSSTRWTKFRTEEGEVYHRFFGDKNNKWHWSGSTKGRTKQGEKREIDLDDVPPVIRRMK